MNRKILLIAGAAVLLLAVLVGLNSGGKRRSPSPSQNWKVIAPDGTVTVPPNENDNVTFVADKPATNTPPAGAATGKK
jgi:hypothetical protein